MDRQTDEEIMAELRSLHRQGKREELELTDQLTYLGLVKELESRSYLIHEVTGELIICKKVVYVEE